MKLDEVIDTIESAWVCPSSDEGSEYCELMEVRDDILKYLKEYREMKNRPLMDRLKEVLREVRGEI